MAERREMDSERIKKKLIIESLEGSKKDSVVPKERRKGDDTTLKVVNMMSFLVWGFWFAIVAIVDKAGRGMAYIQGQDLFWAAAGFWRKYLLEIALTVTGICVSVCTVCIVLNFTRHRRRTDRINRSIILCELFTFIIGIFLMFKLYW